MISSYRPIDIDSAMNHLRRNVFLSVIGMTDDAIFRLLQITVFCNIRDFLLLLPSKWSLTHAIPVTQDFT